MRTALFILGLAFFPSGIQAASNCSVNGATYDSGTYVCGIQSGGAQLYVCVGSTPKPLNKSCCCSSFVGIGGSCSSNATGDAGSGGGCVGINQQNSGLRKATKQLK